MQPPTRTPRRGAFAAGILLAGLIAIGTDRTSVVLAHVLGSPPIRVSVSLDDRSHEHPSNFFFFSVKVWRLCVRIEWFSPEHRRDVTGRADSPEALH